MGKKAILIVSFVISGCTPNFCQQYYTDLSGINASRILPYYGEPKIHRGTDMSQDFKILAENGYIPLGFCRYEGQLANDNIIIEQARNVHASVVLVYSKYSRTLSSTIPFFTPNVSTTNIIGTIGTTPYYGTATTTGGQTQYNIPFSVDRYDQGMSFWVEGKPQPLGVFVADLTQQERQLYQRNPGVVIKTIVKNSPAFFANMLQGDVIVQIEDLDVVDMQDFQQKIDKYAGQEVIIKYLRGDMTERGVKIHLNPGETSK